MKYLLYTVIILAGGLAFGIALTAAWDNKAKWECGEWASQAKTIPGYTIATWQKDQCDFYKINISAPVVDFH